MIGKGKQLKSWKDIKKGDLIWVTWPGEEWGTTTLKLHKVEKKVSGGVMVRTDRGGLLEVLNAKGCYAAIGEK